MKQIIPFVKDVSLKTKISEITSIALEHNLQLENNDSIVGTFTVSGKYKINDISINEEVFEHVIPFDITLDDKYDALKVQIDIDDFYYEIINDELLRVHIDVLANNLIYVKEEKIEILEEERQELVIPQEVISKNEITNNTYKKEELEKMVASSDLRSTDDHESEKLKEESTNSAQRDMDVTTGITSSLLSGTEKYSTYKVHIIRENETLETIKEKYDITTEELEKYNNLDSIVLGNKIIISLSNE